MRTSREQNLIAARVAASLNAAMIESERELREKTALAGSLIQEISDYVKANPSHQWRGRLRFPRGFIKPAAEIRKRLVFVSDETLKRNVSYALMTHEVLRWLAFSTDLAGQAHEMIVKEAVCLLGSITESITIFPDEHGLGRGSSYKKRISRLRELHIIDEASERRLLWLWNKRNQEHLYDVPFREFDHYSKKDWYKSVRAYASLRADLTKWRCPSPAMSADVTPPSPTPAAPPAGPGRGPATP